MLLPLNEQAVKLINFVMSVLNNLPLIPYMMAEERCWPRADRRKLKQKRVNTLSRTGRELTQTRPPFLNVVHPGSVGGVSVTA